MSHSTLTEPAPRTELAVHLARSLADLRTVASRRLAELLPGRDAAILVDDQTDSSRSVELVAGDGLGWQVAQRVPTDAPAPTAQSLPLSYREHVVGELLLAPPLDAAPDRALCTFLDHYTVAVVNLKLDEAALGMGDHYCASLQAYQEGVVLFQESDREAVGARFLHLLGQILPAQAAALLLHAEIGCEESPLQIEHVLGLPEQFVLDLRAADGSWWPGRLGHADIAVHRRDADGGIGELPPANTPDALRNVVACPLSYHGVTAGLALIFNVDTASESLALELESARGLGELGAAVYHRLRLEEQAVQARALETELAIASAMQRRLLPAAHPRSDKLQCAFFSQPSQHVGGDYVDLIDLPDGGTMAVIADVSGHGVNSALLMTSLRAHLRALAATHSPAALLTQLNVEVAREVGGSGMFVTAAIARVAADGRRVDFASAGHNPVPLLAAETRLLEAGGPPLGVLPEMTFTEETVALAPGDVLALYTDGIVEAIGPDEQMFGDERLLATLARHRRCAATEIQQALLDAVYAFAGERSARGDDLSLIVMVARP